MFIKKKGSSIITRISVALACIVSLAIITMLLSYWVSDKADSDALAINVAGSLRMQSYKVSMLSQQETDHNELQHAIQQLDASWQNPVFVRFKHEHLDIRQSYQHAFDNWQQLQPSILTGELTGTALHDALQQQVLLIEQLVNLIQQDAEQKVQALRLIQVVALFLTLLLSIIVMYWLKSRVEEPLLELTQAARRIGQGDFTSRLTPHTEDELGMLANTLNK
ncbi:MAG: type IV pili methyl-accepting chemotaxis transducer N-terminal domain-containing protein, partial [Alkalimonas sp.]|nr:type IV pili methyl-accepting chemotaxis transducer N-terminal domain-containing protein [Alkalimonas sp.]